MKEDPARLVAAAQGGYYVATGAWAFVHFPSFEAMTGPKPERWLVLTVAALVGVDGGVLLLAARRERVPLEARVLGVGAAAALGTIDAVYATRRRIAPTYLLDVAAEAALLAGWAASEVARRRHRGNPDPPEGDQGRRFPGESACAD